VVNIRDLDPSASPLDYYGSELRRLREDAGLKQGELGVSVFCTASLIGQIETARKVPTRDFSERVDAALGTGGVFSRLVGLVLRSQLPSWFQAYAEMEARAAYISSFQAQWWMACCKPRRTRGRSSASGPRTTLTRRWPLGWSDSASWSARTRH
jgi:transcriptional regulator with XRE-family HTH domain